MYLSAFMVIKRSEECLVTRGFYSYGGTFQRLKSQQEMKRRRGITTIESNILTAKSTILVKYREHKNNTTRRDENDQKQSRTRDEGAIIGRTNLPSTSAPFTTPLSQMAFTLKANFVEFLHLNNNNFLK
ncbi:hypothetical protein BDF21DRAFT_496998 [Thamnidium elegans]|nr:hypothetical protein BDF21DRAFT_496998 [Thamnidium elegans]